MWYLDYFCLEYMKALKDRSLSIRGVGSKMKVGQAKKMSLVMVMYIFPKKSGGYAPLAPPSLPVLTPMTMKRAIQVTEPVPNSI